MAKASGKVLAVLIGISMLPASPTWRTVAQGQPNFKYMAPVSSFHCKEATNRTIPYFGHQAFKRLWNGTDQAVARDPASAGRSWYWGPWQNTGPLYEQYEGETRLVQYFDK